MRWRLAPGFGVLLVAGREIRGSLQPEKLRRGELLKADGKTRGPVDRLTVNCSDSYGEYLGSIIG